MRLLTAQVIVTATRSSLNDVEFLHLDGRDVQQLFAPLVVGAARPRQLLLGLPDAAAHVVHEMAGNRTRFRMKVVMERRRDEATGSLGGGGGEEQPARRRSAEPFSDDRHRGPAHGGHRRGGSDGPPVGGLGGYCVGGRRRGAADDGRCAGTSPRGANYRAFVVG
mgnify:CR=1 FL=1